MQQGEIILFWITVFSYLAAFCLQLIAFVMNRPRMIRLIQKIVWGALAFHTATIILRWVNGGHAPVTNSYELNLTGMWLVMVMYGVVERLGKVDHSVGLVLLPVVFIVMGYGLMSWSQATPMSPAYHSPWLGVHVVFAWLAFGCYAISTGAAVLLLTRNPLTRWKPALKILPQQELDVMSYRFIVLGFITHAVMLVSGAIWAKKLWGHYWSWDALETWSLIAFLFYAFYLHIRSFLGWKSVRAAWLALVGLVLMIVSYWGVSVFSPSVHPGP
jgi:cytochrome c-type biogenesis protein CcsB